MSANQTGIDGKLWIMPALLEVFGFSSVLKGFDTFDVGKPWHVWMGYASAGAAMIVGGIVWAVFRKKIAAFWPWHQLRLSKTKLADALRDNLELRERLDARLVTPSSPDQATATGGLLKAQHNVQCAGFHFFPDPPLDVAGLCFRNVPTGKLLGKFQSPRLRVIYYDHSSGQEIADMSPLQWRDSEYGPSEITTDGSYAELAVFLTAANVWRFFATNERYKEVPAGEYRIIAELSGSLILDDYKPIQTLHIDPVFGVLKLNEDGTASFQRTDEHGNNISF